jgi:hypothetical protein
MKSGCRSPERRYSINPSGVCRTPFASLIFATLFANPCSKAIANSQFYPCLTSMSACFRHSPEAIDVWVRTLRQRWGGPPVAVCLALHKGAMVYVRRQYELLVLFPVHPRTLPRSREAFIPSHAPNAPTAAETLTRTPTHPPRHAATPHAPESRAACARTPHRTSLARGRRPSPEHPSPYQHPEELLPARAAMVSGQRPCDLLRLPESLVHAQDRAARRPFHPCNLFWQCNTYPHYGIAGHTTNLWLPVHLLNH